MDSTVSPSSQPNVLVFRMPGEQSFQRIIESQEGNLKVSIVPFNGESSMVPSVYFHGDAETWNLDDSEQQSAADSPLLFDQQGYTEAFEQMHAALVSGRLEKVVLSKAATIRWQGSIPLLIDSLANEHPNAFVYWFMQSSGEQWIGATPELLLSKVGQEYKTMSLAGTKLDVDTPWTDKEILEQGLVSEYIGRAIESKDPEANILSDSYDGKTGHLIHRCTEFSFNSAKSEQDFLSALHPTPAVCGTPKDVALELIENVEQHDREYYCGYIGISGVQHSSYFVNLRTAKVLEDGLRLYAGGGLLPDSDMSAEMNEVLAKMNTITRHLT